MPLILPPEKKAHLAFSSQCFPAIVAMGINDVFLLPRLLN
ncbi:hypothetical protein SAMN02745148_01365 [Modicisalibacter ilicicola DSM 19980]|uniref:Uncharacterized protein n=1 Tax=Modicisalibacter ilicicola DSM 19980 TaxID=1121942 RepID=A0A1M4X820_9GAMM|nr:hypothetical protein SAMN02745148_01365 [Halomonas ilicicola DSM 19980]